jgi:hypothetical protein
MSTQKQQGRLIMNAVKDWGMSDELRDLIQTRDLTKLSVQNASKLINWVEYRDEHPSYYKLAVNRLQTLPVIQKGIEDMDINLLNIYAGV